MAPMIAGLISAVAAPALAQNSEVPLRQPGLFGATRSDVGDRQRLTMLFDVRESLESELPPGSQFRVTHGDLQRGGHSSFLASSADYVRTRRHTQLAGTLFTSFKYYPRLDRVSSVSDSAGLGLTIRLPKQSSLQINSTAAYAPAYLYQLFPKPSLPAAAEPIPADPDYRIDQRDSYSYGGNVALAVGSPRRTRLTATGDYRHTDFPREVVTRPDLTTSAAGIGVSRRLARHRRVLLGYQYRSGNFQFAAATNEHRLSLGAEYVRPLSVSRRATFRFNVSPSILEIPESGVMASLASGAALATIAPGANVNPRLYRLQGDVSADYDFGRTWRATATYRRGLEYLAVLTEPVFSDAARVEVGGLITRRIDVSAAGGHAAGASAIHRDTGNLTTNTGTVRVRYALKRSLAIYSQYLYYYYDLRGQARLAPDLPRVFEQHEIRVGFMLFMRPVSDKGKGQTEWPERTRPTSSGA